MSLFRASSRSLTGGYGDNTRAYPTLEEKRRATRSSVLGTGTLACPSCDAPVAPIGPQLLLTDPLSCPFCGARGPVRGFLSLAAPTRPARVVLRVTRPRQPEILSRHPTYQEHASE